MGAAEFIAAWVVFLVVVLASSRLGALAPKVGLPLITGYLIVGALCGPYVLGVIEKVRGAARRESAMVPDACASAVR